MVVVWCAAAVPGTGGCVEVAAFVGDGGVRLSAGAAGSAWVWGGSGRCWSVSMLVGMWVVARPATASVARLMTSAKVG